MHFPIEELELLLHKGFLEDYIHHLTRRGVDSLHFLKKTACFFYHELCAICIWQISLVFFCNWANGRQPGLVCMPDSQAQQQQKRCVAWRDNPVVGRKYNFALICARPLYQVLIQKGSGNDSPLLTCIVFWEDTFPSVEATFSQSKRYHLESMKCSHSLAATSLRRRTHHWSAWSLQRVLMRRKVRTRIQNWMPSASAFTISLGTRWNILETSPA